MQTLKYLLKPILNNSLPFYQEEKNLICGLLTTNRLHHAILLTSPKSSGKATLVYNICKTILNTHYFCTSSHEEITQKMVSGLVPDIKIIEKDEGKSEIGIDKIRSINDFLSTTNNYLPYKIIIIDAIDELNINACNALLKNLEEPQQNCYFFLICHEKTSLPNTILSRCFEFKLPLINAEANLNYNLNYGFKLDSDNIILNCQLANNIVGKSLGYNLINAHQLFENIVNFLSKEYIASSDLDFIIKFVKEHSHYIAINDIAELINLIYLLSIKEQNRISTVFNEYLSKFKTIPPKILMKKIEDNMQLLSNYGIYNLNDRTMLLDLLTI